MTDSNVDDAMDYSPEENSKDKANVDFEEYKEEKYAEGTDEDIYDPVKNEIERTSNFTPQDQTPENEVNKRPEEKESESKLNEGDRCETLDSSDPSDSSCRMEPSAISSSPDDPVIRILLMGRKGSGKSSSGNTILGERKFKVHVQQKKYESEVCDGKTQIGEKQVHVIDSPDLLDPDLKKEQLKMMKEQLVSQCSGALSAVLLVIPLVKNVENEEEILNFIKGVFGPEVQKYIMILFTHEDELEELDEPQTIDEYLQNNDHVDLQRLVTECGQKYYCVNNKSKSNGQAQELLQKIEEMMIKNGGKFIFSGESSTVEDPDEIPVNLKSKDQIRLVLLGKTGAGKSASGNTIIGRKVFESSISSNSESKKCQSETTVRMGKQISVIDTPGLYDTELNNEEVITEILNCITYTSPEPDAFLIVIKVDRFAEEEKNTIEQLKKVFGEEMVKYTLIIFTHKDQLEEENKTIEEFVQESDPYLKKLVESCGNRFFCLDNESASFPQFRDLINKIEKMVEENKGTHFTNDMFEETEKHIQEIQKQKLDEKEKQFKQEDKWLTKEWERIIEEVPAMLPDKYRVDLAKCIEKQEGSSEVRERAVKEPEREVTGKKTDSSDKKNNCVIV